MKRGLLVVFLVLCGATHLIAAEPSLKLAIIAPIEPWDRQEGIEAFRDWLIEHYNVEVIWIEPAKHQPGDDATKEERKAYYQNPPAIPKLAKAWEADVVYTALTHCALNEEDAVEYLKLITSKPLIGGRRSHHGLYFRWPKGMEYPWKDQKQRYGRAVFGCEMGGHHGGQLRFKAGQADHAIVKGLDSLIESRLYDRGYKYKEVGDDVTVLIESVEGQPQVWTRINKDTKQRVFYLIHDPIDIQNIEAVRQMMARALFWLTEREEADYKKG